MSVALARNLERNSELLESVLTTRPSARVERMRSEYLKSDWIAYIDRDQIEVRSLRESTGEPMVLRRAKAFAAVVRERAIEIFDDELLVGWFDYSPFGGALSVRMDRMLEHSLNMLTTRERNPIAITDEQKRVLLEEIIPFWKGDGTWPMTRGSSAHDDPILPELREITFINGSERPNGLLDTRRMRHGHIGHTIANNERILARGFLGIRDDAQERMSRLDRRDPEDLKKTPFLLGVILAMEAAAELGRRFAARARELANGTDDPARKAELLKIAAVCDHVPAKPARTFHEALQMIWFAHILHWWETPDTAAISPGRMDQHLWPYYQRDIDAGEITPAAPQELIDLFLLRLNRFRYPANSDPEGITSHAMAGTAHHIDIGGYKPDGSDGTNDLSYMFIEGMMHTRMPEPNFGLLVHSKTPEELLIKASKLCALGTGHPMFLNHDAMVATLMARGTLGGPPVTLELARKASAMGCNEPCIAGMDSGYVSGVNASLTKAFAYTLSNGWSAKHNKQLTPQTGDPRSFATFEEFQDAFRKQMAWLIEKASIATNLLEPLYAELDPTVFQSAVLDDCIEKGICREAGGARYNFGPLIPMAGTSDIGDSLAVIKKLIYEEQEITWDELLDAMGRDFDSCDLLRRKLLDAPKFGNDDDYVDQLTAWVKHVFGQEVIKHKNTRGGHKLPNEIPLSTYFTGGLKVGALPSGKKAGQPLADSIGPTLGSDLTGPTAVLNSVAKLDTVEVHNGNTFNMRLDPGLFRDKMGFKRLADFIRTFVDLNIHQIQFNIVSSDTLRAAQEDPASHPDLLVRVAGYVATFVDLPGSLQDTIIERTEHCL
jgi:formate C-acetyltransferase